MEILVIIMMMVQTAITAGGRTGVLIGAPPSFTTWHVQSNGGTRSTATGYAFGQCDGQSTSAYPGTTNAVWKPAMSYSLGQVITDNIGHYETVTTAGISNNTIPPTWTTTTTDGTVVWAQGGTYPLNQHCAFGDFRWLYDAQDGTTRHWVIAGGDTVLVSGNYRIGHDQGIQNLDVWCNNGVDDNRTCYIPEPPAGTAGLHTIIESTLCVSGCADPSGYGPDTTKLVTLNGGYGLFHVWDLNTTNYVDIKGFGFTRNSQCAQHGFPVLPSACSPNGNFPADDFAIDGIATFQGLDHTLLQDLWIYGFPDRGIIGPIGGTVTAERLRISWNGMAGWDFDDGNADPSVNNPTWNFFDSVIEWSGCNQEYPYTHTFPVASCSDQNNAGYGDGVGVPGGSPLNVNINHSISRYNTQDGVDVGHVDTGASTENISNSIFYGNMGSPFKGGFNFTSLTILNNLTVDNCVRMSQPITGTPSTYNTNLSLFCRAGAGFSFNMRTGQTGLVGNNTFIGYSPTRVILGCSTPVVSGGCTSAVLTWKNNVFLGFDDPNAYPYGGAPGGPAMFFCQDNTMPGPPQVSCDTAFVTWVRSNNNYFQNRSSTCPTIYTAEPCTTNTGLTNQPTGNAGTFIESQLDLPDVGGTLNFHPTNVSALLGAGVTYTGLPATDQAGVTTTSPPVEGGLNH